MREASMSLVPFWMWGCGSVGACHQSSFNVPPPPRLVGLKALAAPDWAEAAAAACVAAPAWVAAAAACVAGALLVALDWLLVELLEPQAASTAAMIGIVRP